MHCVSIDCILMCIMSIICIIYFVSPLINCSVFQEMILFHSIFSFVRKSIYTLQNVLSYSIRCRWIYSNIDAPTGMSTDAPSNGATPAPTNQHSPTPTDRPIERHTPNQTPSRSFSYTHPTHAPTNVPTDAPSR